MREILDSISEKKTPFRRPIRKNAHFGLAANLEILSSLSRRFDASHGRISGSREKVSPCILLAR